MSDLRNRLNGIRSSITWRRPGPEILGGKTSLNFRVPIPWLAGIGLLVFEQLFRSAHAPSQEQKLLEYRQQIQDIRTGRAFSDQSARPGGGAVLASCLGVLVLLVVLLVVLVALYLR